MGDQSERPCGRPFKRPWESEVGGRMSPRWGPREADVGSRGSPRWEATRVQGGRPRKSKVLGRVRPKWEAMGG